MGPIREKLAPEEPPEKRAVLMGPADPSLPGATPNFLPRGKVPLRGEERLVGEGAWDLCSGKHHPIIAGDEADICGQL